MNPGDRFANWLSSWANTWRQPVANWIMSWLSLGLNALFELLEPGLKAMAGPFVNRILANPEVDQEIKDQLQHAMGAGNILETIFIELTILLGAPMALLGGSQPLSRLMSYYQDRTKRSFRLDHLTLIELFRRDPSRFAAFEDDLRDLGWSEERLQAFQELIKQIPPLPDMVRFADFSAFDPEVIERWREFYDAPEWIRGPFSILGITGDWADRYWFSHWRQPGRYEIGELHRRGLINDDDAKLAYKTMGYSSFWQDNLLDLVKEMPTRVDVRRWWDMRTIDETELRRIYHGLGYYGADLENYVLWTKVYVAFPDLVSRWQNGWITLDDVRAELVALGMPPDRVDELIQTKIEVTEPGRTTAERDLTKTDIYKGVKTGRITRSEGVELLQDLGYDEDEAAYLIDVNIPVDDQDDQVEYRQLTKSDIRAALAAGEITESDARSRLLELRYSPSDADLLLRIYQAANEPPEETKEREASKADIVAGVKKGVITAEEGYLMLLDIGFSAEASTFILSVHAEESPFSPVKYSEFKDLTTKWRRAAGMIEKPPPEELKEKADELVKAKLEVESLERLEREERRKLTGTDEEPGPAAGKLKEVQVAKNRAAAEVQRIQLEYDALVARWRHGR